MTRWTDFVRNYAQTNNITYKSALKAASEPYRQREQSSHGSQKSGFIRKLIASGEFDPTKIKHPSKTIKDEYFKSREAAKQREKDAKREKEEATKKREDREMEEKAKRNINAPKDMTDLDKIVYHWMDFDVVYLIWQSKYKDILEFIEKRVQEDEDNMYKKGREPRFLVASDLFFTPNSKKLLNALAEKYTLKEINTRMLDIIEDQGGLIGNQRDENYIKKYFKHLNRANRKRHERDLL